MNLRIIKSGILDTVQDLGRYGHQYQGINPGGAMDKLSAQIGNILVANAPSAAVIEVHFPASEFFFEKPALISITGGDFHAHVNGDEVPSYHPILLSKFSILQFHRLLSGARAYISIHGSLDIPPWLGSQSTHLKASCGGFNGHALQKDDELPLHELEILSSLVGDKEFHVLPWKADKPRDNLKANELYILPGNEWERMDERSKKRILNQTFIISSQSDRMGYRLKSESLSITTNEEMISSGVRFYTIQLLPDGKLIILMADHQTTGGYPKIAHVISAHHSRLAQMKAGESIHFRLTDQKNAEDLLLKQQQHLLQLQNACKFRIEEFMHAYRP